MRARARSLTATTLWSWCCALASRGWTNFQNPCRRADRRQAPEAREDQRAHTLDEALDKDLLEWFDQDLATELLEAIRTGNALNRRNDVKN
jgi:hypothetical protein